MHRRVFLVSILVVILFSLKGQTENRKNVFVWESGFHTGFIVKNSKDVPDNKLPLFITLNPSVQTRGKEEWHQLYRFPRVGCKITIGNLGNSKELGYLLGVTPNMTLNASPKYWYEPSFNLGLGVAWFNKPFNVTTNPTNFYIGSQFTVMAEASIQLEPKLGKHKLLTGLKVIHCSNSHYQVPNLGMNIITANVGFLFNSSPNLTKPEILDLNIPKSGIRFNVRSGIGIHELAKTVGPVGTPKYAIYVNDIYLSKLFGKVSNVHAGLEIKYYKSYYNYIVTNDFFPDERKLKSTVFTAFLAHELMVKRFSLVTQGGINVYNKFYGAYMNQFLSERGFKLELKKIFSTRLGVQYYLFDPKYCTRANVFVGGYIKAHFGQADFICFQAGMVL